MYRYDAVLFDLDGTLTPIIDDPSGTRISVDVRERMVRLCSLADVAMVSYTSQAHLAGLPLEAYPRIAAWVARMQALPGYPVLADQLPTAEQVAA